MKRLVAATLSTLVLTIFVTPGAQALRPELQPEQSLSTPSQSLPPSMPKDTKSNQNQPATHQTMDVQKSAPAQQQQSEETTFEDLERAYMEKYGS